MSTHDTSAPPGPNAPLSVRKKLLFSLVLFVLFFGALEVGTRLSVEQESAFRFVVRQLDNDVEYPGFVEDRDLFWRMKENMQEELVTGSLTTSVRTNSHGLRGPDFPTVKPAGERRILFLGDSSTFGLFVPEASAYPFVVSKLLNGADDGPWRTIDAGVCGYTSFQCLQYLKTRGIALNPDVVVCCFGTNDARFALPLDDETIWARNQTGPAVRLMEHSAFFRLVRDLVGATGGVSELASNAQPVQRVSAEQHGKNLKAIARIVKEHGARPVLAAPFGRNDHKGVSTELLAKGRGGAIMPRTRPSELETPFVDAAATVAHEEGVLYVPLKDMRVDSEKPNAHLFLDQAHPNIEGHARIAREIADALRQSDGVR